jgi:hypothetical protein
MAEARLLNDRHLRGHRPTLRYRLTQPGAHAHCLPSEDHAHCLTFNLNRIRFLLPIPPVVKSPWLQIRGPGFDSRHYQKKVVGLERGPLSLVSTIEKLLDRKVAVPV